MSPSRRKREEPRKADALVEALPQIARSMVVVLLMWLFAEFIFLPLSAESFAKDLGGRVSSIVAVAFIIAIGSLLPETAVRRAYGESAFWPLSKTTICQNQEDHDAATV